MTSNPLRTHAPTAQAETSTTAVSAPVVTRTSGTGALLACVVTMFLMPWLVWGSAIAQAHGIVSWRLPQGVALWVLTPSLVVGALAVGGRPALADLVRRIVRRPGSLRVHAAAVAVPVAVGAVTVALTSLAGNPTHLGETTGLAGCAVYFCYAVGLFLLTEEAGWTGLLLPRLQARWQPLVASLLLGAVWGVWHLPLLHVPDAADAGLPFAAFLLLIVPTRVVMSALVNATGGAVLVAAVFHAAFNATCMYVGVVGSDHTVIWVAAGVMWALALAVVATTRGRLLLPATA